MKFVWFVKILFGKKFNGWYNLHNVTIYIIISEIEMQM